MSAQTSSVARRDSRAETNVVVWAAISTIGVLLASVVLLIAVSLLSWATDRPVGSTAGSASKVAMQAWYLAHSVPLPVSWGSLSVPPLLVTGFVALLFYRSGRGAVRACGLRTPLQIAEALAAIVVTYVTCAVLLSGIAYPSDPMLSIWEIVVGTGALALVASLAGLLRESGLGAQLVAALPGPSYAYARGALAACWSLAAMSAIAVGVSLVINYSEASALTAALSPNGLGGLTIIGISIAYLPNAMLLAVALGSGAGFTLGDGSLYSLGTVDREALPIFPLFSALPHEAGGLALLSVLVPLVAAVVGALTMTRHLEPEHRTATNLLTGSVLCSVLTAVGVLGVGLYAAGGLGDGRLSVVGASAWRVAVFLAVGMTVAVVITAFIATRRSLKPVSVARRERALAVLETGDRSANSKNAKGSTGSNGSSGSQDSSGSTDSSGSKDSSESKDSKGSKGSKGSKAGKKTGAGASRGPTKRESKTANGSETTDKSTTGHGSETADGSTTQDGKNDSARKAAAGARPVGQLEPDGARRPVIVSKLAMRRLARGGKRSATAQNAAAAKKQPTSAPKTAPAASLSVVKRAQAAQSAATSKSAARRGGRPGGTSQTNARVNRSTKPEAERDAKYDAQGNAKPDSAAETCAKSGNAQGAKRS